MGTVLRLRAFLDANKALVLTVLLVLALFGGWLTYTAHAAPGTTTESRTVSWWEPASGFDHWATVTGNNSVYPVGTTLTNRSIYISGITPHLNGTYDLSYEASDTGTLNGTVSLALVLRSVEPHRERETVVWRTTRELETTSFESLGPGETVSVPFSVDVNATENRTERIEQQLGNPPGQPETLVRASVHLRGSVNGRTVSRVTEHALPIALQGATYRPARPGTWTDRRDTERTVTVPKTYGPIWRAGGPLILVGATLSLASIASLGTLGRLSPTEAEQNQLSFEADRRDFDEWISRIRLPESAFDLPQARAASLGALVDFAIDTDNGVVEDPRDGGYYVVHDDILYTYWPPPSSHGEPDGDSAVTAEDDHGPGGSSSAATRSTADGDSAVSDESGVLAED